MDIHAIEYNLEYSGSFEALISWILRQSRVAYKTEVDQEVNEGDRATLRWNRMVAGGRQVIELLGGNRRSVSPGVEACLPSGSCFRL
jgi:hypothetical protein